MITLPIKKKAGKEEKAEKELISIMEQLYVSLSTMQDKMFKRLIYGNPYFSLEISVPVVGEEISFYLAVPRGMKNVVEKQIHGFYPQASVEDVKDEYNIFNPEGVSLGSILTLEKSSILPIRTYQFLEADSLNEITNALSKLEERGEGAALQILITPVSTKRSKRGLDIARFMQEGQEFKKAQQMATKSPVERIVEFIQKGASQKSVEPKPFQERKPITPSGEEVIKAIESKANKINFRTNVRLVSSAATEFRAREILSHLESAFSQFTSSNLNSLVPKRLEGRKLKKLIYEFSFRIPNSQNYITLSTEELSTIYHFPHGELETPKVKYLKAKQAPAPANLPKEGLIIGKNIFRGIESLIRIDRDDRRRHLYVIGQTGTGKSVLMQEMIRQDIESGEGVAFIDPHGDSAERILSLVPRERAEDVIYFNPSDVERPMGLNMLEFDPSYPEQKTFIANEMVSIFKKLYEALPEAFGPVFEQYMRNSILLVMDDPESGSTLVEVPKVLTDSEFRRVKLSKTKNPAVKDFWLKEAEKAGGEYALANMAPYITSKMNMFLANDIMRPIISQQKSAFNFRKIMDEGKILIVNLSKGRLGDINAHLLGLIIVGKLLMASLSRVDMPEDKRRDFYLYLDEFQNFTTESISTILAEARKYRLCLTIAHQFIGQLEERIKNAVFGNVGSMAAFRVGPDDADFLVKQFEPVFDENDLINLDNFHAYLKLMARGETSKPFNINTFSPSAGDSQVAESIKEYSRFKYGEAREDVEKEMLERSKIIEGINGQ